MTTKLNRADPAAAAKVVKALLPNAAARKFALRFLADSIRVADGLDAARWAVTLTSNYVRLNVGWVEAVAFFEGCLHVVCRHDLLPQDLLASGQIQPAYSSGGLYPKWAPESCSVDLIQRQAVVILPRLRQSHDMLIRDTVRSPLPGTSRKAHSTGVIVFLNTDLGVDLTQPSYAIDEPTQLPS